MSKPSISLKARKKPGQLQHIPTQTLGMLLNPLHNTWYYKLCSQPHQTCISLTSSAPGEIFETKKKRLPPRCPGVQFALNSQDIEEEGGRLSQKSPQQELKSSTASFSWGSGASLDLLTLSKGWTIAFLLLLNKHASSSRARDLDSEWMLFRIAIKLGVHRPHCV